MIKNINHNEQLMEGFQTAAICALHRSNLAYRPEFLSNNPSTGRKVLASIEQELASCDQFKISVAFITKSGVTPLLQVLKGLEEKGGNFNNRLLVVQRTGSFRKTCLFKEY